MEVEFLVSILLQNISRDDIAEENKETFTAALEQGIAKALGLLDDDIVVEIVSWSDDSRGSYGNDALDVELKIYVSKDCHVEDCSDPSLSGSLVVDFRDTLEKVVQSGALTYTIQQAGKRNQVEALETAWVGDQESFVRFSVRVRDADEEENGISGVASPANKIGASPVALAIAGVVALFFGL